MRIIKIFLASSISEFRDERNEIGDLIRRIQDKLIDEDIRIKLFQCEFFDNSISISGRKQNDYNEEIKNSDIFIMVVGKRLGDYTKEEYRVAISANKPMIHILFKKMESDYTVDDFKQEITDETNVIKYEFVNSMDLENIISSIVDDYRNKFD